MCLLRELRRHGVGHQRRRMLLRSLCLGEGERGMTHTILCTSLTRGKLLSLEITLTSESTVLVVKVGLSITVVAASTVAVGAAVVAAPVASILCVCAKSFVWSIVIASTTIPVSKTAKITPSRGIPIPAVISKATTSASP